ncbi:MAG: oligosaccharide flippase family protein [Mariprofundaceae bacterium]|nr:oligosaccharide flippase family protein [Mariprofundaceae bacterium]
MPHKRSLKEKILKGGAWSLFSNIITAVSTLAVNVLLARLLTPNEMGEYFLILSFVMVAVILAQLGLPNVVVRLIAESISLKKLGKARMIAILMVKFTVFGSLVMALFIANGGGEWVLNHFFGLPVMASLMGITACWVVVITFQNSLAEVHRGFHDIRLASMLGGASTSTFAMLMLFSIWMIYGHSNLVEVIVLTSVAGFISVFLSSVFFVKKIKNTPLKTEESVSCRGMMKIAWPLLVTTLMLLVAKQADIWVVGYFLEESDVAIYGAALRIVTLVLITTTILYAVFPPIIAELNITNEFGKLQQILSSSAFINSIIVLPLFIALIIYPDVILKIIYGDFYEKGGTALMILSIGVYFNVLTGLRGIVLMLTGYEKTQMLISALGGVLSISFCIIGAKEMGIIGVAIGSTSGMILQCLMELIAVRVKIGIWTIAYPYNIRKLLKMISIH